MLADLGAEVLKVERPGTGDDTRAWGPPFAGGESAYFLCLNRGKKSLALDLACEADRERARGLARRADVVVENFRVGWMAEHGLDYAALRAENPRLVYCSITGYGQTGPDAHLPGYDFLAQARGGLMAITGEPDGAPMKVGVAVADLIAGLHAATGILAALHARERTGEGAYLDVSLLDCQVAALANVASNYLVSGVEPPRYGNAHPNIVPYQVFAADGPVVLAVGNDAQWCRLCDVLGHPEWGSDPRFAANAARVERRQEVVDLLGGVFCTRTREAWISALAAVDVPAGPVQSVAEVFRDPQVLAREMLQPVSHPAAGDLRMVVNPLLGRETPCEAPPTLGAGGPETAASWLAPDI